MSDTFNPYQMDARDLYQLILQSFPTTGKNPQTREKDRAAFADQIYQMLGFNPLTYQPAQLQPYTPKMSAVRIQYGNDPVVAATLDNIDKGDSSAMVASKLIDPDTGGLTEDAKNAGISLAQAQASVDAAKDYEKEKANNITDQMLYEDRQKNDPTFGRTKSNAPNANLPDGNLGFETPRFMYSQNLLDMLQGLDSTPGSAPAPPRPSPAGFDIPASAGGQVALNILPADQARAQHRPNIITDMPAHPAINLNPRQLLPAMFGGDVGRTVEAPSRQERAAKAAGVAQDFVNSVLAKRPKRATAANNEAVTRLLQIQQALGG